MSVNSILRLLCVGAALAAQTCGSLPVFAQTTTSPAASVWQPGPDAVGDNTYTGSVDQPAAGSSQPVSVPIQLSGWVVDTTAQGWTGIDDVQIWNSPMNLSGQQVAHPLFQTSRPDVAAALNNPAWSAAGFVGSIAANTLLPGPNTLYVYAHTPAKGWWYKQAAFTLVASDFAFDPRLDLAYPTPLATLHGGQPVTVRGTAIDRNASASQGTGVDRVQVYLDGDRKTGIFLGDATLGKADASVARFGPQFASGGWELTFTPTSALGSLSDNQISKISVYARSSVTGQETETSTAIMIELP
jgi:hypothetical protein